MHKMKSDTGRRIWNVNNNFYFRQWYIIIYRPKYVN